MKWKWQGLLNDVIVNIVRIYLNNLEKIEYVNLCNENMKMNRMKDWKVNVDLVIVMDVIYKWLKKMKENKNFLNFFFNEIVGGDVGDKIFLYGKYYGVNTHHLILYICESMGINEMVLNDKFNFNYIKNGYNRELIINRIRWFKWSDKLFSGFVEMVFVKNHNVFKCDYCKKILEMDKCELGKMIENKMKKKISMLFDMFFF